MHLSSTACGSPAAHVASRAGHLSTGRRGARLGLVAGLACSALVVAAVASADGGLPNPCTAVASGDVVSALGLKHAPASVLSSVPNIETCSFDRGALTVSVGFNTLANPAVPAKVVTVPGLPNGTYRTYTGSTQTEILFVKGAVATGVYGVVRNFAKITEKKLTTVAKDLYAGISGQTDTQTAPSVKLVAG
jgi:hypothetical protein